MLEKEKEAMCEFAFNCGDEIKELEVSEKPH
jgi:hypothetical protein